MAVAFLFEASGVTQEQYDAVMKDIGRESVEDSEPDGVLGHVAGATDGGWRVMDIWESEEKAGAFYGTDQFRSALQSAGIEVQPQMFPLHRLELSGEVRQID